MDKTKVIMISKEDTNIAIHLKDGMVEQMYTFKYLGMTICKDGSMETEINNKIENAVRLFYSLESARYQLKLRLVYIRQ